MERQRFRLVQDELEPAFVVGSEDEERRFDR